MLRVLPYVTPHVWTIPLECHQSATMGGKFNSIDTSFTTSSNLYQKFCLTLVIIRPRFCRRHELQELLQVQLHQNITRSTHLLGDNWSQDSNTEPIQWYCIVYVPRIPNHQVCPWYLLVLWPKITFECQNETTTNKTATSKSSGTPGVLPVSQNLKKSHLKYNHW